MKTFENVRGMRDFLPEDLAKKSLVEDKVRECLYLNGYGEIETPIIEPFGLIAAKAGDEIRHRMYVFKDLGGRRIAMRPEMTASVARLVAGKLRSEAKPLRLGYIANCFRYDNPQMGRYREFWQAGFELFGSGLVEADAEIVIMFYDIMKKLGFKNFTVKLGNVGILHGLLQAEGVGENDQNIVMGYLDKRRVKKALAFLGELKVSEHCRDVIKRLVTLRGTDWMSVIAKGRTVLGNNDEASTALSNLEEITRLSMEGGVTATILVDLGFTRGLEYYTGMIFEVFIPDLGIALGGGGRYDKLVELFGGEPTPAVGCSPGIDRIVLAMEKESLFTRKMISPVKAFIIPVGKEPLYKALKVAADLRSKGISTQMEVSGRSIGSSLSYADRKGFPFAIIIGLREIEKGSATVRDMRTKVQREIPMASVTEEIEKISQISQ
ncbi:MAG: histidine--tRNA ligase [Candidatus Bathyarchaeota archaeon]